MLASTLFFRKQKFPKSFAKQLFSWPPTKMTIKIVIAHFWGIELRKTDR